MRRLSMLPVVLLCVVSGLSALALLGWALGEYGLASLVPGQPAMKVNTAVGFLLLAGGLGALLVCPGRVSARLLGAACGVVVLTLGITVTVEHLTGWNAGIGELLARDVLARAAGAAPGRLAPPTAAGFVCCGLALALHAARAPWRGAVTVPALGACCLGAASAIGLAAGAPQVIDGVAVLMAPTTAVAFIAVGASIVLARPERIVGRLLLDPGPARSLLRWGLPLGLVVPVSAGGLDAVLGLDESGRLGVNIFVVGTIAGLLGLLIALATYLDRHEHARRQALQAVQASQRQTAAILRSSVQAFVSIDEDGTIVQCNPSAERTFGFARDELLGRPLAQTLIPERFRAAHEHGLGRFLATGQRRVLDQRLELLALCRDGREIPVEMTITAAPGEHGWRFHAFMNDITQRRAAEHAVHEAQQQLQRIVDDAPIGMAVVSLDGRYEQVNDALCDLLGYDRQTLLGMSAHTLTHHDDAAADSEAIRALMAGEITTTAVDKRYLHAAGHVVWTQVNGSLLRDGDGKPEHFLGQIQDITERRHYEQRLQHMADHDPLTGLLNRRSFERELDRHRADIQRYGIQGAAIVLDLDHFKYYNDTLGHTVGDELIVRVAHALRSRVRQTDILARLGGDEFAVILPHEDRDSARRVAEQLLASIRRETVTTQTGRHRGVTASVGIATFLDEDDLTAEDVLINADLAMYDAKEAGRDRVCTYRSVDGARARVMGRMKWVDEIQHALDHDGFTLLAQPIIDLKTNQVARHELLLRLRREDGELIPPGAFLYIAERLGLIEEIDRWVARRAIALLASHHRAGHQLHLEVNLSGRSIGNRQLLELIQTDLATTGAPADCLTFEITETAAVANIARARDFAERLSALGCQFALDDFGAGFGSFYYLKHLPFDVLKIDGEFVRNCASNLTDQLLIQAVVSIARGMNKRTIAEFVSDDDSSAVLRRLGVDMGQGYHLGRPMPLQDIVDTPALSTP